jgi:hypothetical protein
MAIGESSANPVAKLQLVRTNGQELQTLFCVSRSSSWIANVQWAPDSPYVAFDTLGTSGQAVGIEILDLTTARLSHVLVGDYAPQAWLDATRLYVATPPGNAGIVPGDLYLLDTGKGPNQQASNLTHIASFNAACGSFAPGADGMHIFTTSCTRVMLDNCQSGYGLQGSDTLSMQPATGGRATTIYSSRSQAIVAMHAVNSQTLLLHVENSAGDLSQDGLWKINAGGGSLTRLTTEPGQRCEDLEDQAANWPQVSSNAQSYALRVNGALMVGSLNGGTPATFATMKVGEGILDLVGLVTI